MVSIIKPKLIACLVLLLIILNSSICHASYEVYSAKTIKKTDIQKSKGFQSDYSIDVEDDDIIPDSKDTSTTFSKATDVSERDKNTVLGKTFNFFKRQAANRKKAKITNEDIVNEEIIEEDTTEEKAAPTPPRAKLGEIEPKNKFKIEADNVSYDDLDGNVYANGHVRVTSKEDGLVVKSDKATISKPNQTIKFEGNVQVVKNGVEMRGDFLYVDLNEENILMEDPSIDAYSFTIKAQQAFIVENDALMTNGVIKNNNDIVVPLVSHGFQVLGPYGAASLYDYTLEKSSDAFRKKPRYSIAAKEIVITNYKDHDGIYLKDADVAFNNHKFIRKADLEIFTDKKRQIVETSLPEFGSISDFGTYFGYGIVKKLWGGQSLKVMPALVYDSGIGLGIMGRHQSENSYVDAGWATCSHNLVLSGRYNFGKSINLMYGRNAYEKEGFMGAMRPRYAFQLQSEKAFKNNDLRLTYRQGFYAGLFTDYRKRRGSYYSTARFRYLGQLSKTIKQYENQEQDLQLGIDGVLQGGVTQYGSGETFGLIRVGPTIRTRVKKWESRIGYLMGGTHGDTPFAFDRYRYGKSSIILNEKFNLNNAFAIGYSAVVSPLKDNYDKELLTESRLYAMFGPRDVKLAISYDFVREIAHFDFMFLLGLDSTKITFDKLKTQNADSSKNKRDFYRKSKTVAKLKEENI